MSLLETIGREIKYVAHSFLTGNSVLFGPSITDNLQHLTRTPLLEDVKETNKTLEILCRRDSTVGLIVGASFSPQLTRAALSNYSEVVSNYEVLRNSEERNGISRNWNLLYASVLALTLLVINDNQFIAFGQSFIKHLPILPNIYDYMKADPNDRLIWDSLVNFQKNILPALKTFPVEKVREIGWFGVGFFTLSSLLNAVTQVRLKDDLNQAKEDLSSFRQRMFATVINREPLKPKS